MDQVRSLKAKLAVSENQEQATAVLDKLQECSVVELVQYCRTLEEGFASN